MAATRRGGRLTEAGKIERQGAATSLAQTPRHVSPHVSPIGKAVEEQDGWSRALVQNPQLTSVDLYAALGPGTTFHSATLPGSESAERWTLRGTVAGTCLPPST